MAESHEQQFTLGSASPRRAALLADHGLVFGIATVPIDEADLIIHGLSAQAIAERIARAKFDAFTEPVGRLLLTADTLVACDGQVMGKPSSNAQLRSMLAAMSGRELQIATAVCVGPVGGVPAVEVVTTMVKLRELTSADITDYVATDAGMDKAGGLALQAEARPFIAQVTGCWANVLGLPVCVATDLLGLDSGGLGCCSQVCGDSAD